MPDSAKASRPVFSRAGSGRTASTGQNPNAPAGLAAQEHLGNTELRANGPVARMAHGAELLRAAGFCGMPTPANVPMSAMRALMRMSQAAEEGLDTSAASGAIQRSSGAPLPDAIRARLETAFGHDFSHVRVHTDGAAAEASVDLNALAFTLGSHVFFGPGQFSPSSSDGLELIAHELMHVVQADEHRLPSNSGEGMDVSSPQDAHEREAVSMGGIIAGQLSAPFESLVSAADVSADQNMSVVGESTSECGLASTTARTEEKPGDARIHRNEKQPSSEQAEEQDSNPIADLDELMQLLHVPKEFRALLQQLDGGGAIAIKVKGPIDGIVLGCEGEVRVTLVLPAGSGTTYTFNPSDPVNGPTPGQANPQGGPLPTPKIQGPKSLPGLDSPLENRKATIEIYVPESSQKIIPPKKTFPGKNNAPPKLGRPRGGSTVKGYGNPNKGTGVGRGVGLIDIILTEFTRHQFYALVGSAIRVQNSIEQQAFQRAQVGSSLIAIVEHVGNGFEAEVVLTSDPVWAPPLTSGEWTASQLDPVSVQEVAKWREQWERCFSFESNLCEIHDTKGPEIDVSCDATTCIDDNSGEEFTVADFVARLRQITQSTLLSPTSVPLMLRPAFSCDVEELPALRPTLRWNRLSSGKSGTFPQTIHLAPPLEETPTDAAEEELESVDSP